MRLRNEYLELAIRHGFRGRVGQRQLIVVRDAGQRQLIVVRDAGQRQLIVPLRVRSLLSRSVRDAWRLAVKVYRADSPLHGTRKLFITMLPPSRHDLGAGRLDAGRVERGA